MKERKEGRKKERKKGKKERNGLETRQGCDQCDQIGRFLKAIGSKIIFSE